MLKYVPKMYLPSVSNFRLGREKLSLPKNKTFNCFRGWLSDIEGLHTVQNFLLYLYNVCNIYLGNIFRLEKNLLVMSVCFDIRQQAQIFGKFRIYLYQRNDIDNPPNKSRPLTVEQRTYPKECDKFA